MEVKAIQEQDNTIILVEKDRMIGVENEDIQGLVKDSIANGSKAIVIDLGSVKYISSWGIGILVQTYAACQEKNIKFNLRNVQSDVLNILNQVKLTSLFSIK